MNESDNAAARRAADDVVMIWRSGPDMACTDFSESWLAFAGRPFEEEEGDRWAERVHPDDLAPCLDTYRSAFAARRAFHMQYRLRRCDGDYRWILDIGTPEWDDAGRFLGYVGSCVDVNETRQLGVDVEGDNLSALESARGRAIDLLTRREQDVTRLLASGLSTHQIADNLVISVATVRVHVEHILNKLGLHSRAQVAAWVLSQRSWPATGGSRPGETLHSVPGDVPRSTTPARLVVAAEDHLHRTIELLIRAEQVLTKVMPITASSEALHEQLEQLIVDTRQQLANYRRSQPATSAEKPAPD